MYSFYCSKCGASYSDPNKDLVHEAKNIHILVVGQGLTVQRPCIVNRTNRGTWARPDLVEFLNAQPKGKN